MAIFAWTLLAGIAGWAFFYRLGVAELNDWDEAWHAQVASEILSSGQWVTLHDRGLPYFNKPPLSFWMKAVAFKVAGIHEGSTRFFPALFGWASVLLSAGFFASLLGRPVGWLTGLILSSSWLFVLHHAGRSGETDSTLIFFQLATVVCLWHARVERRWLYAAAIFTALGWMTKGSTAYLAWAVAGVAQVLCRWWGVAPRQQSNEPPEAIARPPGRRSIALALMLSMALTLPWQLVMLLRHGRAFARVFYVGEGAMPALQVVENHPGAPGFHLMMLHLFFQPWLLLAAGAVAWIVTRRRARTASTAWVLASAVVLLGACTVFATKMVWYSTPALPALAALAALAIVELTRRQYGWVVIAPVAVFACSQSFGQFSTPPSQRHAVGLMALVAASLIFMPARRAGAKPITMIPSMLAAGVGIAVPLVCHFALVDGVVRQGDGMAEWSDLGVDDEAWRPLCDSLNGDLAGRPIGLVGMPLNPAAYFYLHQLRCQTRVEVIEATEVATRSVAEPKTIFVSRIELDEAMRKAGLVPRASGNALVAWGRPGH